MATLEADWDDSDFPMELCVNLIGSGGVSGLACTVALRLFPTTNFYLDWTTNTFKNSGWGVKFQPMTDIGNGMYQVVLDILVLGFTPLTGLPRKLIAEYNSPGIGTGGLGSDTIVVSEVRPDTKLSRQFQTNRLEAEGGAPNGTLTLFEDDGVTIQSVQPLTDYINNPVNNTPGTPAKRGPVP
jgi:hypothetical protein